MFENLNLETILIGGIILIALIILIVIIVGGIKAAKKGSKELNDNTRLEQAPAAAPEDRNMSAM